MEIKEASLNWSCYTTGLLGRPTGAGAEALRTGELTILPGIILPSCWLNARFRLARDPFGVDPFWLW